MLVVMPACWLYIYLIIALYKMGFCLWLVVVAVVVMPACWLGSPRDSWQAHTLTHHHQHIPLLAMFQNRSIIIKFHMDIGHNQ